MSNGPPPPHERPSLSQLAASTGGGDGWECPRCGCCDWRVTNSRQYGEIRKRVRACRNCHQILRTIESIETAAEESDEPRLRVIA